MTPYKFAIILLSLYSCFAQSQNIDSSIFDEFKGDSKFDRRSEWGVISQHLRTFYVSPLNSVPTQRTVSVRSAGLLGDASEWALTLENESGYLSFENQYLEEVGTSELVHLGLYYTRRGDQNFSFTGINTFSVEYELKNGAGSMELYVNYPSSSKEILIGNSALSPSGTTSFQFQDTGLDSVESFFFRIYPESKDFSITLNSIHAVPESTTWSLLMLGGAPWVWRCFRAKVSRKLW